MPKLMFGSVKPPTFSRCLPLLKTFRAILATDEAAPSEVQFAVSPMPEGQSQSSEEKCSSIGIQTNDYELQRSGILPARKWCPPAKFK